MERDQVYVPKTWEQITTNVDVHTLVTDSPLVNFLQVRKSIFSSKIKKIFVMLLVGWPFYLATNAWGQDFGKRANHFEPWSPIFKPSHVNDSKCCFKGKVLGYCN